MTTSIVLADDHGLMREGLRALLAGVDSLQILAEAENGREAVALVEQFKPDIVLMDISMSGLNGLEASKLIGSRFPETGVIIISMHTTEEYVARALQAGAKGYVLKQGLKGELVEAIQSVREGKTYVSSGIDQLRLRTYLAAAHEFESPLDILTLREREVLQLIAEGMSNQEIAISLIISPKTVERHRANLMEKLNLHNTAALVRFAVQNGLVSLGD